MKLLVSAYQSVVHRWRDLHDFLSVLRSVLHVVLFYFRASGDVLVYIDGQCVLGHSHQDIIRLFQSIPVGETVTIDICRGYPLPFDPDDPSNEIITTVAVTSSVKSAENTWVGAWLVLKGCDTSWALWNNQSLFFTRLGGGSDEELLASTVIHEVVYAINYSNTYVWKTQKWQFN